MRNPALTHPRAEVPFGAAEVAAAQRQTLHAPPADRRRLSSRDLLGQHHEIEIAHGDSIYRLRLTSLGKLILTK